LWNESFFSAPQLKRDPLGAHRTAMSLPVVLALIPAAVGWGVGVYLQVRALGHLRSNRLSARVAAFLLGPFGGSLYTLEAFRYRGLAMLSTYTGFALTAILLVILRA
jgi:hypothetical protein